MVALAVATRYPPESGLAGDVLEFGLWEGYNCRDAAEAHGWILELVAAGDDVVAILDSQGESWEFYKDTIAGFAIQPP